MKALPKAKSLAQMQRLLDRDRLGKQPELLKRKWKRMAASPFAFLRGAALLFDECLRRAGSFAEGPKGGGALIGDLHLENFGVFRTDRGAAVFHVNDFDALRDGPWRFDVLRLLTSVLLARPELKASGTDAQALAEAALDGHQHGLLGKKLAAPAFVRGLLATARAASPAKLLGKHVAGGKVVADEKHPPLPAALRKQLPSLLTQCGVTAKLLDARRRVAGTGSLGVERVMMLLEGDVLLEAKEVAFSAGRVVEAQRAAVETPPAMLAAGALNGLEVVVKQLGAGEDKLDLDALDEAQREPVVHYLGFCAGQAHRRLARSRLTAWTEKERSALLVSARRLAAMHEEAFLDFCGGG